MKIIENEKYYKMSELSDITNVNKSTIQHYKNEGLLPNPLMTSKNMSYYKEITIPVINLIKYLQFRFKYKLSTIKAVFKNHNINYDSVGELILNIIEIINNQAVNCYNKLELNQEVLKNVIEIGLLQDKEKYNLNDIEMIGIFEDMKKHTNLSDELIKEYVEAGQKMAKIEKKLIENIIEKNDKETKDLPEILILDVLTRLKPFILNNQVIKIFKEEGTKNV